MTLLIIYLVGLLLTVLITPLKQGVPLRKYGNAVEALLMKPSFYLLWPKYLFGHVHPHAKKLYRVHKRLDRHFRIF